MAKPKQGISSLLRKQRCHFFPQPPPFSDNLNSAPLRIWARAFHPTETLWPPSSLTVSQFSLGIASYELVFSGKRNPFGNLFVRAQDWNTSHEDTVKEKCHVSCNRPGEKAQVVLLHWWSSRDVINAAMTWWQSLGSTTCWILISALSYSTQRAASVQHCRKSVLSSWFCSFFHNILCLNVTSSLFYLLLEELAVLSSRCWAPKTQSPAPSVLCLW